MTTQLPTHRARRRLAVIPCLALATLGVTAASSPAASRTTPLGACILRPAADSMPFEAALLDTYRIRDGTAEILHNAHCSDGRAGSVWIRADVISP